MNRARLIKLWPYAAIIGVLILCLSGFMAWEGQGLWFLGARAVALIQTKWRALSVIFITLLVVIAELFLLEREKTTLFRLFVRRNKSAIVNAGFTPLNFSGYKWVADYVFTLGAAYGGVTLGDAPCNPCWVDALGALKQLA